MNKPDMPDGTAPGRAAGAAEAAPGTTRPASSGELFRAFTRLALEGFGGVLPVAQRALVERHNWLTRGQFLELLSMAQVLPGPNIVNMALIIGDRFFGWRGAMAALAGILLAPLAVVLLLALAVQQLQERAAVTGALRGMGVVAAGLIVSTALKLSGSLRLNALGLPLCVTFCLLTLLCIAWLRWPLAWVVLGLGSAATALAWQRLPQPSPD